jgi:hypothetical protein
MKRIGAGVVSAWLLVSATVTAADVWESKPFNTWTAKELEKVLTSSPWAGKGGITYVRQTANQQPIQEQALVTWASARVMREALVREEFGATPDIPKEGQAVIAQKPSFYMVTVKISKGTNSASHANRAAAMQNETFLQLRGKPPIPAQQAEGQVLEVGTKPEQASQGRAGSPSGAAGGPAFAASPGQRSGGSGSGGGAAPSGGGQRGGTPTGGGRATPVPSGRGGRGGEQPTTASLVIFRFPRDPITLEDKEVEFVTKLCGGRGFGGGAPVTPPSDLGGAQFELAAGAQRGGGGGTGGGSVGGPSPRVGDPLPACNYYVKKKFKLKDMVVNGELQL